MLNNKDIEKLSEVFATKEDLKNLSEVVYATKNDLLEFKNEILEGQDQIMGKLEILLDETTVGGDQNKRQKKVLQIHHNALKAKKILSEKEALEINKLQVF